MWSAVGLTVLFVSMVEGIVHGEIAPIVPWQAAIYRTSRGDLPICGGTLVGEDLVVSSASCFTDESGEKEDLDDFTVMVGKRKSRKNVTEDTAQERKVKELIIPERYKGYILTSSSDIALVRLSTSITPSTAVQPISIPLNQDDSDLQGHQGQVAGWGLTEAGSQSEELRMVKLPFVNFTSCFDSVPNNFRPKLTPDKFCAGSLDGPYVCRGDFGSGWTIVDNYGQHQLRGVLSEGQTWASFKGQCKQGVAAFTSITAHRDWLRNHVPSSAEVLRQNILLSVLSAFWIMYTYH